MKANPYLNFDGQAEEAFIFYKSVFGGEFTGNMKMKDAPDGDKLPKDEQNRVMHISLPISENILLMASDIMPSMSCLMARDDESQSVPSALPPAYTSEAPVESTHK